jgi:hypothetical protein
VKMNFEVKSFRCRVCDVEVHYTEHANPKLVELELCYEHWKNMI